MLRVSGPHVDLKRVDVRRLKSFDRRAIINAPKSPYEASEHSTTVNRSVEARTAALGEVFALSDSISQRLLTHHQHWPHLKGAGLH